MSLNQLPARLTGSGGYTRPLMQCLGRAFSPLEFGFLISKGQAVAAARSGMALAEFAKGHKLRKLSSEMIPSWVAARAAR